ncbi:MAG: DUF6364 family protein [Acidobacteriota bacterium]
MKTEQILEIDQALLGWAQQFAKSRGISLATLVEQLLVGLAAQQDLEAQPEGLVAELAGSFKDASADGSQGELAEYLARKYA